MKTRVNRNDADSIANLGLASLTEFHPFGQCGLFRGGRELKSSPSPSPAHYFRTASNSNLQPMGASALTTLKPDMTSMVVSPFASKLHLPLRPSKSLVAAMAALIFSRSFTPARLIPSITTCAASQE